MDIGTIAAKLTADTSQFSAGMKQAAKETGAVEGAAKSLQGALAALGLGALASQISKLSAAAIEQRDADRDLAIALRGVGQAARAPELSALAGRLQGLTGIADDVTIRAQRLMAAFQMDADSIAVLTPRVQDLATVMGVDMSQAAVTVAKAWATGSDAILKRSGVVLSEQESAALKAGTSAEKAAILAEAMASRFGGAAEEAGKSASGLSERWKRAEEEIAESIGNLIENDSHFSRNIKETLLPALQSLPETISSLPGPLRAAAGGFLEVGEGSIKFAAGAVALTAVLPSLVKGFDLLKASALMSVAASIGSIALAVGAVVVFWETLRSSLEKDIERPDMLRVVDQAGLTSLVRAEELIDTQFGQMVQGMTGAVRVLEVVKAKTDDVGEAAVDVTGLLQDAFDGLADGLKGALDGANAKLDETAQKIDDITHTVEGRQILLDMGVRWPAELAETNAQQAVPAPKGTGFQSYMGATPEDLAFLAAPPTGAPFPGVSAPGSSTGGYEIIDHDFQRVTNESTIAKLRQAWGSVERFGEEHSREIIDAAGTLIGAVTAGMGKAGRFFASGLQTAMQAAMGGDWIGAATGLLLDFFSLFGGDDDRAVQAAHALDKLRQEAEATAGALMGMIAGVSRTVYEDVLSAAMIPALAATNEPTGLAEQFRISGGMSYVGADLAAQQFLADPLGFLAGNYGTPQGAIEYAQQVVDQLYMAGAFDAVPESYAGRVASDLARNTMEAAAAQQGMVPQIGLEAVLGQASYLGIDQVIIDALRTALEPLSRDGVIDISSLESVLAEYPELKEMLVGFAELFESFGSSITDAASASDTLATSASAAAAALMNVPSGWRIALRRYESSQAAGPAWSFPMAPQPRATRGSPVYIDKLEVRANDPADLLAQIERVATRRRRAKTSTTQQLGPVWGLAR